MVVTSKIKQAANKAAAVVSGAAGGLYAAYNAALLNIYCGDFFTAQEVTVNPDMDATAAMGKLLTIIAGAFIAVGLFMLISGLFSYLEAKSEDNAMGESKAVKKMAIGAAFVAAPVLVNFVFG